ncbi:hypothetical protein [Leisingera sp. ANG-S5]|uniref:hypothetical protein n=1 Tax=Leisingera sp. ANG-S5 TaxID=1577901 RepID=UPI001F4CE272|nr:hypothetical protein [Leisingera sp. ANG-S5]
MPIALRPVARSEFDLVSRIEVEPDQIRFSGTVAQAFEEDEDGVDFHAILDQNRAHGIFRKKYHARRLHSR